MPKEHDDILALAAERFRFAAAADRDGREKADQDTRFAINYDGAQWDERVRQHREGANPPRPCLVVNKITEKIDLVEGEFRQMEPSFKVRAVDSLGDPQVATVITGMVRHIEANSKARTAYNTAYSSVLYAGRGAWRIDIQDCEEDPFVRELAINRISNILSIYPDPEAKQVDKSDMKWCFVTDMLSKKEYEKQYPDAPVTDWPTEDSWQDWLGEKEVRIAEYWWKEEENVTFYRVNRQGQEITVTETTWDDEILEEKKAKRPKIRYCKMVAGNIIYGPYDFPGKYIPIVWVSGKETNVAGENYTRGMVRFARDPQMLYNYNVSSNAEVNALAPKVPYLVTPEMISQSKPMWDMAPTANFFYLLYSPDPNAPGLGPRREPPPQASTAFAAEIARSEHDINGSMGLHEPSLGQPSQERSGRAIMARQSRGSLGAYTFISNFNASLEHGIRVIVNLIPYVYDTQRVVRIIGEDDEEMSVPVNAVPGMNQAVGMTSPGAVPGYMAMPRPGITNLLNDLTVGKYDVVVTVGPSYTTIREETLAMLMELVKVTPPQLLTGIYELIIENFDMPKADKLKNRVKQVLSTPPPPDPKVQIEFEKLALQLRKQVREEFDAHFRAIQAVAQAESMEAGSQLSQYQTIVDNYLREKEIETQRQAQMQQAQQGVGNEQMG